jgi:hypothetical protein
MMSRRDLRRRCRRRGGQNDHRERFDTHRCKEFLLHSFIFHSLELRDSNDLKVDMISLF